MESLALASSSRLPLLAGARRHPPPPSPSFAAFGDRRVCGARRARLLVSARSGAGLGAARKSKNALERVSSPGFASISPPASTNSETMTASTSTVPLLPPPSPSFIGSPPFWIGIGVGIAALVSTVTSRIQQYAMRQAFKTMMNQAAPMNGQINNSGFPGVSPFPFPPPQAAPKMSSAFSSSSKDPSNNVTVDVSAAKVEAVETSEVAGEPETVQPRKKFSFVDVSQEELLRKERQTLEEIEKVKTESTGPTNGASFKEAEEASYKMPQPPKSESKLTVDTLEKMMEDPTVQKMVYPHLPEEMRNPETFKWMLQNPQYRQQLQDMLNNMGGTPEWDSRMMDSLKNFDLSNPEVKQQFEQIGMTPEEVASRIMDNPDVAMAFYNPKIQAAILDCSQNPLNIAKYQNDKEVMDAFNKISELFPGVSG